MATEMLPCPSCASTRVAMHIEQYMVICGGCGLVQCAIKRATPQPGAPEGPEPANTLGQASGSFSEMMEACQELGILEHVGVTHTAPEGLVAQIGIRCACGYLNVRALPYNPHKADDCEFCEVIAAIPERTAQRETGWLIEENVSGYIYWIALAAREWPRTKVTTRSARMNSDDDVEITTYRTPVVRVTDAGKALRFARREDAEAFIKLFDRFLLLAVATDHEWSNPIERGAHIQESKP